MFVNKIIWQAKQRDHYVICGVLGPVLMLALFDFWHGAILGTGAAVDVAGVAWGASENAVCDGVGQLSDPLEGHVI
jgi:hypothetical protein